ncbi:MAG: TonB-dependent receptor domain-containing protein [Blastocatellia bacterium]
MSSIRTNSRVMRAVILLALLSQLHLFSVPFAMAQVTTGSLQGVVTDPNKAVVAGATVRVTNVATGQSREMTTNQEGFWRVTNLIPGDNYRIEVSAAGFAPKTLENVPVRLGVENSADISMAVAGGGETVNVTAGAQLIETTQSQLTQNFTTEQITRLPFVGSVDNLALLTPGVIPPGDTDFANGVGISANGNRGRSNNFQIDGQDNNDNSVTGPSLTITNTEAIGEYQVITNAFSAEFGRNSGAQINQITKPGTNDFHGSLFEYHRNSRLNARTLLEKRTQQTFQFLANNGFNEFTGFAQRYEHPAPFRENRFGGSLGGPIKRDKAFFFFTYQGTYFRGEDASQNITSGSLAPNVESGLAAAARFNNAATAALTSTQIGGGPAFVQGAGTAIVVPPSVDTDGDGIPDTFVFGPGNPFGNPVTPGFLSPLAVIAGPGGRPTPILGGEIVRNLRTDSTNHQIITRIDYNFGGDDRLTGRYIYDHDENPLVTGRFTAGAIFDVPSRNHNLGLLYTHTFSPRWINEAAFNFSRLFVRFGDPNGALPGPGISFSGTINQFGNLGLAFGTQNNLPQDRLVNTFQVKDTVGATLGTHGLKFGADIRRQNLDNFFLPNFLGTFTFRSGGTLPAGQFFSAITGAPRAGTATAFENLLLGRPFQINFALGNPRFKTHQNDYFFFMQDDWRIRPTLTLNLGLRYEVSTSPFNPLIEELRRRESDASTAIFDPSFPIEFRTAERVPIDKNNFGPNVGFAWQPNWGFLGDRFANGRTVIRGGFRLAYDPPYFNIVLNTVTAAPFAASGIIRQATPGAAGTVNFPFLPTGRASLASTPGTNGGDPRLFSQTQVAPNFYNPYTMSFNFGIQQEIFKGSVLEVRYVGSRIVGQFQTVNANPDLRFLAAAGQFVAGDPGLFTGGVVAPGANAGNNFASRPGTNGNGRLDPSLGPVRLRTNGATSTYNGLQTRFDTRLGRNITINANYTLSKTIDNASEIFGTFGGGQTVPQSQNPFNTTSQERALSAFHQKHNFTLSAVFELPVFRDQRGFIGHLLGGWEVNSIIQVGSGKPYTPVAFFGTYDPAWENGFVGSGGLRPFLGSNDAPEGTIAFGSVAASLLGADVPAGQFIVFNTKQQGSTGTIVSPQQALQQSRLIYNDFGLFSQFGVPLDELEAFSLFRTPYGNVGRNTFFGDPLRRVNLSVFKTTNITESKRIEFRAEAFNIFNSRNLGVPDPIMEDAFNGFTVSTFQNTFFNTGSSRTLRLGVRFLF